MSRPLLLVGTGGLGRETAEAARAGSFWKPVAWADDDPAMWGTELDGLPVLGGTDSAVGSGASVVLCPGRGATRGLLADRLAAAGLTEDRYATVVHPAASIAASCTLGAGSVVLAGTVLTASVTVGRHAVLMPGVVLTHDDVLADLVTVCARATLAGGVQVGTGAYLGAGCLVREHVAVGAWSVVGMGAVVLRDVPAHETWAGVPARQLGSTAASDGSTPPQSEEHVPL